MPIVVLVEYKNNKYIRTFSDNWDPRGFNISLEINIAEDVLEDETDVESRFEEGADG